MAVTRISLKGKKQFNVSEDLIIAKDSYGWIVRRYYMEKKPITGKETRVYADSFYGTFKGAAIACIEESITNADELSSIINEIQRVEKQISKYR